MNSPIKIAHRGYCKNHKSNTLGAFHDAVAHGFDMIEMDIQLTKNNDIIVMHDTFIDCKEVCMQEYAELKFNNPELLLLNVFFKLFDYTKTMIYFDMKGDKELAHILHKLIVNMNIDITNIWFASFNMKHLDILSGCDTDYNLGYITENIMTQDILHYIINKYALKFVCIQFEMLDHETIEELHNRGVLVFIYTIQDIRILDYINKFNIDGIVSDI
jgi:glycerophosphoryl diester phosphodiesterase